MRELKTLIQVKPEERARMAYVRNSTNLKQVGGGFLVKQGDVASTLRTAIKRKSWAISRRRTRGIITLTRGRSNYAKRQSWQMVRCCNLGMILPAGLYQIEVSVGIYIPKRRLDSNRITKSVKNTIQRKFTLLRLDMREVKKQLAGRSVAMAQLVFLIC